MSHLCATGSVGGAAPTFHARATGRGKPIRLLALQEKDRRAEGLRTAEGEAHASALSAVVPAWPCGAAACTFLGARCSAFCPNAVFVTCPHHVVCPQMSSEQVPYILTMNLTRFEYDWEMVRLHTLTLHPLRQKNEKGKRKKKKTRKRTRTHAICLH
eukprot:SAG11_NODE_305_length_10996_cov_4.698082_5_plen_157_part_00